MLLQRTPEDKVDMAYGTASVAVATTPTVISKFFSHFLVRRKSHKGTANAELSYDEGLAIIRSFLEYASKHTVEELQSFTKNKVPVPNWVFKKVVTVQDEYLDKAANILRKHFKEDNGLQRIGGGWWWTVRDTELQAEWIEMEKDRLSRLARRKQALDGGFHPDPERIIFYIHGGAYFFSSLETHRYQIQRHARKLKARAFSPAYRLAPQYPFPCALQDALASYLYLLENAEVPPSSIVFSGDSAGAGMLLSLLCVLRDQQFPMPAGASLISPWVDLTHSFPSILKNAESDYIPAFGFHFKPSLSWPPLADSPLTAEIDA